MKLVIQYINTLSVYHSKKKGLARSCKCRRRHNNVYDCIALPRILTDLRTHAFRSLYTYWSF